MPKTLLQHFNMSKFILYIFVRKIQKNFFSYKQPAFLSTVFWSEWRDLNSRPLGPEPSTLPTALHPDALSSFTIIVAFQIKVKDYFSKCRSGNPASAMNYAID